MSSNNEKRVRAVFMLEVLGRPPEHLIKTLEGLIEKIKGEKGLEIKEKKIKEPVLMKDKKDLYTAFAEIEFELDGLMELSLLMFKYMPSHVEIISPENITTTNNDMSVVLNELIRRLHGYDEVTRIVQVERKILENKLKSLLEEKKKSEESKK